MLYRISHKKKKTGQGRAQSRDIHYSAKLYTLIAYAYLIQFLQKNEQYRFIIKRNN